MNKHLKLSYRFNALERGESIWHADNLEWQKGRETSFMTAAGFLWKISAGGAAMMRSRDLMLINDGLDLTRKFSLFYGSAGISKKEKKILEKDNKKQRKGKRKDFCGSAAMRNRDLMLIIDSI